MARKKSAQQERLRLVKVPTVVYLEPEQAEALELLCKRTRVSKQVYMREGIDLVLTKYDVKVPKPRAKK